MTSRDTGMRQALQQVTDELRHWILAQVKAGCSVETVHGAMIGSGWSHATAADALEQTLHVRIGDDPSQAALPRPTRVPEPRLDGSPTRLWAADRDVHVVMAMRNPRIVVFGEVMDGDECDELRALARPRLERSTTVDIANGSNQIDPARSSQGMFFDRGENPLCARIERRISVLLDWPVENGEGLQILRYEPGTEFRPHHDYFDPTQPGPRRLAENGGQRVGTLLIYLDTPARGGGTIFPDVQLELTPLRGHAVFFSYDRPHRMTRTLHGGAPVIEGEKWVATKWLRERPFH